MLIESGCDDMLMWGWLENLNASNWLIFGHFLECGPSWWCGAAVRLYELIDENKFIRKFERHFEVMRDILCQGFSRWQYIFHRQQNKRYSKSVFLPISKLHSILAVENLLFKFLTTIKFHYWVLHLSAVFLSIWYLWVRFILLAMVLTPLTGKFLNLNKRNDNFCQ